MKLPDDNLHDRMSVEHAREDDIIVYLFCAYYRSIRDGRVGQFAHVPEAPVLAKVESVSTDMRASISKQFRPSQRDDHGLF